MIKVMFAHGPNGEFAFKGGLPWDVKEDLKAFKEYTDGCVLVMGAATFESLPGLLPGRPHVVLGGSQPVAKNGTSPTVHIRGEVPLERVCDAMSLIYRKDICVIGGRRVIDDAVRFADEVNMTCIKADLVKGCDTTIGVADILDNLQMRDFSWNVKEVPYGTITIHAIVWR